jgi:hypothetical protein
VGQDKLTISTGAQTFSWPVQDLHDRWWNAIARAMR